uniref:Uncharacterized protein n=1 Tax=Arundo donax TaxID=35708 RepID=A0A0A9CQQ3_ARUDO
MGSCILIYSPVVWFDLPVLVVYPYGYMLSELLCYIVSNSRPTSRRHRCPVHILCLSQLVSICLLLNPSAVSCQCRLPPLSPSPVTSLPPVHLILLFRCQYHSCVLRDAWVVSELFLAVLQ